MKLSELILATTVSVVGAAAISTAATVLGSYLLYKACSNDVCKKLKGV